MNDLNLPGFTGKLVAVVDSSCSCIKSKKQGQDRLLYTYQFHNRAI